MSEQPGEPAATADAAPAAQSDESAGSSRTGDGAVDAVLGTLERLDQLSAEEHLPLFEHAHEALRQALNRPAEAAGPGD